VPEIDVSARARATPERVWGVLTDVEHWADWAPFDEISVESGVGVGELRRVRSGRITTHERVVALEPPHRYVYEIVAGLPVRDYVAEILLSSRGEDGTQVRWRARFRATIPGTGWVLKFLFVRVTARAADALVKHADQLT
jgi:uncharacterized protein YndB with AHSA1/START domain